MNIEWNDLTEPPQITHNYYVPPPIKAQLANSPPCCSTLAELPYQSILHQGKQSIALNSSSPSFHFDSGKSYFAAFRLPNWPRPLTLRLDSLKTTPPGSSDSVILYPLLLVLDQHYQIIQTSESVEFDEKCPLMDPVPLLSSEFTLDTSAANPSYIVILTSDALRQTSRRTQCGSIVHEFSPMGEIELTINSLGFGDGNVTYRGEYYWFPNAHGLDDVSSWSGLLDNPGTLLLTGDGLHFVEQTEQGNVQKLAIPNERILTVAREFHNGFSQLELLVLGLSAPTPGEIEYHTFSAIRGVSVYPLQDQLQLRIKADRHKEKVGIAVINSDPVVNIKLPPSAASQRLLDDAIEGGLIGVTPCEICESRLCTPDVLLPCAALFAVGSVVGGVVSIGDQLLAHPPQSASSQPSSYSAAATVSAMQRASASGVAGMPLMKCLAQHLDTSAQGDNSNSLWHSQGRQAEVHDIGWSDSAKDSRDPYPALKANGYTTIAEIRIDSVSLQTQDQPDDATKEIHKDPLVHLRIAGKLRYYDLNRHLSQDMELLWLSSDHTWAFWGKQTPADLKHTLEQACDVLAKQAIRLTRVAWERR
ncbi:MAG: MalM family protein [Aeromonadaceae bacterium]